MKKIISFVLGATLALTLVGFSFSDSVLDYLDNIGGDTLFGYVSSDKISVDSIGENSVTIKSPVLKDEFDDVIGDYTLMYGEYPLAEILDDPTLLDYSKEKAFENLDLTVGSNFTINLDSNDDLDKDIVYYVVVVPKDDAGSIGDVSNEICFRLTDQVYGEGDDCKNTQIEENTHGAGADMNLANISHVINGNKVTLRWVSIVGSDKIEIFLRDEDAGTFSKLSTVNMDDETYSFNISKGGEHIVKFIPDNGGANINYTFNAEVLNNTTKKSTVTPVVVGPKENIIAILIGTLLIYIIYRVARRKA